MQAETDREQKARERESSSQRDWDQRSAPWDPRPGFVDATPQATKSAWVNVGRP
jgi:hypothetical protein